jgi:glycerol-3-phosphate acyltransferase PlsX
VIRISIDAMGGDVGPAVVIPGAARALERYPDVRFIIFGLESQCLPLLERFPKLKAASEFHHCDVAVRMDDKPSQALRKGRWRSSMWRAIEAVKTGDADVCVSAGNTGALMAMAKFCLRTMANIERPAIAAIWPTVKGESIVLDVGATVGADAQQLIDFAMMGGAMARALFEIERPSVGLLNVGVEEIKGQEEVKEAGPPPPRGQVPGAEILWLRRGRRYRQGHRRRRRHRRLFRQYRAEGGGGHGPADRHLSARRHDAHLAREARLLLAKDAFDRLREKMDPRKVNGGVFLGLNGIVIKSHGGTDARASPRPSRSASTWRATTCATRSAVTSTSITRATSSFTRRRQLPEAWPAPLPPHTKDMLKT